jgi:hypothetical protein
VTMEQNDQRERPATTWVLTFWYLFESF